MTAVGAAIVALFMAGVLVPILWVELNPRARRTKREWHAMRAKWAERSRLTR
jgi:hypothetical protein